MNKAKYGDDFYKRIGSIGGKLGHTGGFAANPDLARLAGAKGGRISRRRRSGESNADYQDRLAQYRSSKQVKKS